MRNFRGPIRRYPGSLSDSSSDDDDNDYDVYLQPGFRLDQDDSDAENGNEDRFEFNLVFNAENGNISTSEEEEEDDEEEEEEDDAMIDEIIEIDADDFEDLNDIIGNRNEIINADQPRSPNSSLPRLSQSQIENGGENPTRDSNDIVENEDVIDDIPTPPQPSSPVLELQDDDDVNDIDEEDDDGQIACFSNGDENYVSEINNHDNNDYCDSARFSPVMDSPSSSPDHHYNKNNNNGDNNDVLVDGNNYNNKDNNSTSNIKMDCTTSTTNEVEAEKDKDSDSSGTSATSSTSSKYRTIIHQFINDLLLAKNNNGTQQENDPDAAIASTDITNISSSSSIIIAENSPGTIAQINTTSTTTNNNNSEMDCTNIVATTSEVQVVKDNGKDLNSSSTPTSSKLRTIIHQYIGELVLQANPELQDDSDSDEENNLNYPEIETLRHSPNPNHDDDGHSPPQEEEQEQQLPTTTTSVEPSASSSTNTTSSSTETATDQQMNINNHNIESIVDKNNRTPPSSSLHCEYSDSSAENTPKKDDGSTKYEDSLHEDQVEDEEDNPMEQFCNPFVEDDHSDGDGDDRNEEALRGDRIGNTTYSERHVLKILMNWVSALPKFDSTPKEESIESGVDPVDRPLSPDMEESMALLWDMSAEADVMHYLIDKNILGLIIDNLDSANCPTRLKEIALGILANILSCSSILESFPEKDEDLNIVERVVAEGINSNKTSVLTQSFAVLRRVICYMRNAKPVSKWMKLFLSEEFIQAANFLLSSSTNVLLLGDVIIFMFTLLEILNPSNESEEENHEDKSTSESSSEDNYDTVMTKNFQPITSSGDFVPSICEGLTELLKKGSNHGIKIGKIPSPAGKIPECGTTGMGPDEVQDDLIIPRGHVQQGLLNGLASLCYLNKFKAGRNVLSQHSSRLMDVLLGLFGKFQFITEIVDANETLDYFAIAVDLLSFIHKELDSLIPTALTIPSYTGIFLIEQEEKDKKEQGEESHKSPSQTPVSHYKIILYNYFVSMEEKFSTAQVKSIMSKEGGERLNKFYEDVISIAEKIQSEST